jgi:hypothetical protein
MLIKRYEEYREYLAVEQNKVLDIVTRVHQEENILDKEDREFMGRLLEHSKYLNNLISILDYQIKQAKRKLEPEEEEAE